MPQGPGKRKAEGAAAGRAAEPYKVDWRTQERRPFRRGFIGYGPCGVAPAAAVKRRKKLGIDSVEDPAGEDATPLPLESFEAAGVVPGWLLEALQEADRFEPSPIEAQALPIVLAGQNLIAVVAGGASKEAAGGTGSAAYLVPAAVHAEDQAALEEEDPGPIVLVLAAQDLCARIAAEASRLLAHSAHGARHPGGLRAVDVSGGGTRSEKLRQLGPSGAHVVVGTPKRVHDMASKGQLSLLRVTLLVLDGADRLLDKATLAEVRELHGWIRPERQTVLVAATWPRQLHLLAGDLCYAAGLPVRVSASGATAAAPASKKAGARAASVGASTPVPDAGFEEVELEDEAEQVAAAPGDPACDDDFPDDWEASLA